MYESLLWDGKSPFVDTAEYLSRHDVVYHTPALKGYEGLPIGNGSAGGPVYHTEATLEWPLSHCDAVDFAPEGPFRAWAWEWEEKHTALFSPGRLRIRSPLPLFSWPYLQHFEERLSLGDATLTGEARTPFASLLYRIFASEQPRLFVLDWDLEQTQAAPLSIELERWGTPNFFHHYEQVSRTHSKGLEGTASAVEENTVVVTHQASGTASAIAARVIGAEPPVLERTSSHGCALRFPARSSHRFTLLIAVETAPTAAEAREEALAQLEGTVDLVAAHNVHARRWRDFWNRSFVHLPDDYLENLYYLHLYQLQCCGRGRYPPLFGGLWTWFGDSRNWGHFYHWNHQQTCWGLYPAGQWHLAQNYLDYRNGMLDKARADAVEHHGAEGIFFSDIASLNGWQAHEPDTLRNYGVGPQIALDFYRHFRYTGDEAFLAERAAPLLREAMAFYASKLVREEDGLYRLQGGSTCYESYLPLRETLPDHAAIRCLLAALFSLPENLLPDGETLERYRDILARLYPAPTVWVDHQGQQLEIFSDGVGWDGRPLAYAQEIYPRSPFPATLHSMVYPSGPIGLGQRGTREFELARNTARVLFDREVYTLGELGCSGHSPSPQMAARLGMGEDAWRILRHFAETYQVFPNGMMHFADINADQQWGRWDRPRVLEEDVRFTRYEELHDQGRGTRTKIDSSWFLHPYFEAAACITDGIQQCLLQSHDGVIRLFPSMEPGVDALFRLHAANGVTVTAELGSGEVRYALFSADAPSLCRVENPWPGRVPHLIQEGRHLSIQTEGSLLLFEAGPAACLLTPADAPTELFYCTGLETAPNPAPKHRAKVQIGLDRIY